MNSVSLAALMVPSRFTVKRESLSWQGLKVEGRTVAEPVTVPGVTPPADDPIVCRAQPDTGSRIAPRKDCRKRSEWANKAKARTRTPGELRMGDCGGGDSSCNNAHLPSSN